MRLKILSITGLMYIGHQFIKKRRNYRRLFSFVVFKICCFDANLTESLDSIELTARITFTSFNRSPNLQNYLARRISLLYSSGLCRELVPGHSATSPFFDRCGNYPGFLISSHFLEFAATG